MSENQIWYWVQKLNGMARILVFPMFLMGSFFMLASALVTPKVENYEMPVILVYCNERDFTAAGGREAALANNDIPLARCSEKVVWQGDKSEAISGLAYSKGESIVNSLFATPKSQAIVREAIAKNLEYFEPKSVAESIYKRRADEAVMRSTSYASTFRVTDSYVRLIERENPDENRWVVKFTGIWVTDDGSQKGKDMSVMLSFKAPRYGERKAAQQALIVANMEVSGEG